MRNLAFLLFMLLSSYSYNQIVYVDKFDMVYEQPSTGTLIQLFDINSDGENDITLEIRKNSTSTSISCPNGVGSNVGGPGWTRCTYNALENKYGSNKINASSTFGLVGIDCTNDTLNLNDTWATTSRIYNGFPLSNAYCDNIGFGSHKQGFRLLKTNPLTSALGYIYGYIDYTLTNNGDIIVHGWYYESSYNVPIVANTMLDYPYDGNCIHIDTLKVYDTITTFVAVADTLKINLNIPNSSGAISINTLKVYPNPASTHLYIDMGSHTLLNNYELQILNNLGQPIYFTPIDKKEYYLDLNTFGGKGIYFLRIRNQVGITIETKKIILQ